MEDRGRQLLVVILLFMILTWFIVSLRCFVRVRLLRSFGFDDGCMVLAQLVFTVLSGLLITGIHYGIGSHNASLEPKNLILALKYQTLSELVYIVNTALIKSSIGLLLLRFVPDTKYKYTIWISIVVLTLWTVVTFFVTVFQCKPLSFAWDQSSGKGSCMDPNNIANLGYAFSAEDIFFDWLFALLPIAMLWGVQMTIQLKISIVFILSLGIFVSTATVVRLKYLVALRSVDDILYTLSKAFIWSIVQIGMAITVASIATLRPLFKTFRIPGFSSSNNRSNEQNLRETDSGYIQSYNLSYVLSQHNTTKISATSGQHLSQHNNSEEFVLGANSIQKTTDVDVSYN